MIKRFSRFTTLVSLTIATTVAFASPPKQLITHNLTDDESNAYVAGVVPSQHPTKPHSDGKVLWAAVKMACFGHITNNKCWAVIKMRTNTANPVEIGQLSIDMETGEIMPEQIVGNGYTMTVVGPGETSIVNTTY